MPRILACNVLSSLSRVSDLRASCLCRFASLRGHVGEDAIDGFANPRVCGIGWGAPPLRPAPPSQPRGCGGSRRWGASCGWRTATWVAWRCWTSPPVRRTLLCIIVMSFLCIAAAYYYSYYSEGVEVLDLAAGAAHVVVYRIDITVSLSASAEW